MSVYSSLIFRMVRFLTYFCVALMFLETSTRCQSFSLPPRLSSVRRLKSSTTLSMSSNTLSNMLGLMPLCLTATSKTTTTNDPTAGMSPEEIVNYISNVGGGMCGYPEWVRTSIGVGLNLSLLAFGLATVSYGQLAILSSLFWNGKYDTFLLLFHFPTTHFYSSGFVGRTIFTGEPG